MEPGAPGPAFGTMESGVCFPRPPNGDTSSPEVCTKYPSSGAQWKEKGRTENHGRPPVDNPISDRPASER